MKVEESTNSTASPTARITAFDVGHGDAVLIEWEDRDLDARWSCLIDGGPRPGLAKKLTDLGVMALDLVIVSHLDSDHVNGLRDVAETIPVRDYWGPALPAFERHEWLFGDRCRSHVQRGKVVEESFPPGTTTTYPLEGYRSEPFGPPGPSIEVLSPSLRLIRHLLVSEDVERLFASEIMPLGWLASEPDEPLAVDDVDAIIAQTTSSVLSPEIARRMRRAGVGPERGGGLRRSWCATHKLEPEFFGNSVLNNTSLVVWLELPVGPRRQRLLFPGDQENWTYLLARNPRGLRADVLKAPHHGGRVFLESALALDEVLAEVRPAAFLVSGNGAHGLPLEETRRTAERLGTTVLCTRHRGRESVVGRTAPHLPSSLTEKRRRDCCYKTYDCHKGSSDLTLTFRKEGIEADRQACHSGRGDIGPAIEVRTHIIDPSPIVSHLVENELRRHLEWCRRKLTGIHIARAEQAPGWTVGSRPLSGRQLLALADVRLRPRLEAHRATVIRSGHERGVFWAAWEGRAQGGEASVYALPTPKDVLAFCDALMRKDALLFADGVETVGRDPTSLVTGLVRTTMAAFCDALLHYPQECFEAAFWPRVVAELTGGNWHCFARDTTLALSQHPTAESLMEALGVAFRVKRAWDDNHYFSTTHIGWASRVLVTPEKGVEQRGRAGDFSAWDKVMKAWLPSNIRLSKVDALEMLTRAEALGEVVREVREPNLGSWYDSGNAIESAAVRERPANSSLRIDVASAFGGIRERKDLFRIWVGEAKIAKLW